LIALGVRSVVGQSCSYFMSCSSCLAAINNNGCVWDLNACWDASQVPTCLNDVNCVSQQGNCPIAPAVGVYATAAAPLYTPTIAAAPVVSTSLYAPATTPIYPTSTAYPTVYPTSTVYPTTIAPALTTSVAAPITSSYTTSSYPAYGGASYYGGGNYYGSGNYFGGGVYAGGGGGGLRGGAGVNLYSSNNLLPSGIFSTTGNPVLNTAYNQAIGNALNPLIPGISTYVNTASDINLLQNSNQLFGNVLNGRGYNNNPIGAYVQGSLYANEIGGLSPSLKGTIGTLNNLDLLQSLIH